MESRSMSCPTGSSCRVLPMCFLAIFVFSSRTEAATYELLVPRSARCACPGDLLTFTCTVVGAGNTLWSGSAFMCSNTLNEIILRHSQFANTVTSGDCNSGAITAKSLRVENNNCYVSELNVTVNPGLNGKTVQCQHSTVGMGTILVDRESLHVISAENPYPPPTNISLTGINQTHVTFSWTSASASCSSIEYIITADCGDCPLCTNATSATCTNFRPPSDSDTIVCTFGISSRVCGIDGNPSTPVTLAIPDIPRVNIVPCYSNNSQELQQLLLEITMNKTTVFNDISGSITNFIVITTLMDTVTKTMIPAQPCEGSICNYVFDIPGAVCSSSADFNVTVSASNKIGEGQPSDALTVGCTNKFVQLDFVSNTSTFFCIFLTELDDSRKSCGIDYWMCDQELVRNIQSYSTTEKPNKVSLMLPDLVAGMYCYVVTASSLVMTVKVNGTLRKDQEVNNTPVIVVGILLPLAAVVILLIIVVVAFIVYRKSKVVQYKKTVEPDFEMDSLKLKLIPGEKVEICEVDQNYELREFITKWKPQIKSWRGCVFYELTEKEEYISEDKSLIFLEMKKKKFFKPEVDCKTLSQLGLVGKGITKVDNAYRVFVQSKGSGARLLESRTHLLYVQVEQGNSDVQHIPVPETYFVVKEVDQDDKMLKDVVHNYFFEFEKFNVFLDIAELQSEFVEPKDDALLMDENRNLFMVPFFQKVASMVDRQKWKKFRVCRSNKKLTLKKGVLVVYENPKYVKGTFAVLEVDEDGVRLSEFVREKLGSFDSAKSFYEFDKDEYLPWCRKMIRVPATKLKQKHVVEQARITTFYEFPGAPGEEVKPKLTKNFIDFIHCQSQGSRYLRKGTHVLYNLEYLGSEEVIQNKVKKEDGAASPQCVTGDVHRNGPNN